MFFQVWALMPVSCLYSFCFRFEVTANNPLYVLWLGKFSTHPVHPRLPFIIVREISHLIRLFDNHVYSRLEGLWPALYITWLYTTGLQGRFYFKLELFDEQLWSSYILKSASPWRPTCTQFSNVTILIHTLFNVCFVLLYLLWHYSTYKQIFYLNESFFVSCFIF